MSSLMKTETIVIGGDPMPLGRGDGDSASVPSGLSSRDRLGVLFKSILAESKGQDDSGALRQALSVKRENAANEQSQHGGSRSAQSDMWVIRNSSCGDDAKNPAMLMLTCLLQTAPAARWQLDPILPGRMPCSSVAHSGRVSVCFFFLC